jgi:Zn-dependent protease with chaperone function
MRMRLQERDRQAVESLARGEEGRHTPRQCGLCENESSSGEASVRRLRFLPVSAGLFLFLGAMVYAAPPQGDRAASPEPETNQQAVVPAPGQTVPPPQQPQGYTLSPEKYANAVAYSKAQYRLYFIGFAYGLIALLLVLRWRLGPKYRDWAEGISRVRFVQAIIFTPLLLLTLDVLDLPLGIYRHWLSLKYDISVQKWGSWAWDWTKGELIGFVIGSILIWILYAVIRRSARRWWFYFWLASLPILLFLFFIGPYVIDPLFNKFEPLEKSQPALVTSLEQEVTRAGMHIPPERMFLMKASVKTKALNAYVTGFGASKRVVVWDTTIEKMTLPETLYVFGHEMGHYVLGHIWKLISSFAIVLLVFLYLGYRFSGGLLARRGPGWGIRGMDDWASFPALTLLLTIFSFFASPVINTFSRHFEHEADLYGLEVTHGLIPNSSEVAAHAFQVLGEVALADPHPSEFIKVWLYSHPPVAERVAFAQTYDPWSKGKSPKFVK